VTDISISNKIQSRDSVRNFDVRHMTEHLSLFGHVACMYGKVDTKQILLSGELEATPWAAALYLAKEYHQ